MSKCTPKSERFISDIYGAIEEYNKCKDYSTHHVKSIDVYYDGSPHSNRDYVAYFEVNRNYHSCYSNDHIKYLMRKVGATNIIGGFQGKSNLVGFAFDIKQSKLKELEVGHCD